MDTQSIIDQIASVCADLERQADTLQDTIDRAREKVHDITTVEQREKLLNSCRSHPDEVFKKSMFAVMHED